VVVGNRSRVVDSPTIGYDENGEPLGRPAFDRDSRADPFWCVMPLCRNNSSTVLRCVAAGLLTACSFNLAATAEPPAELAARVAGLIERLDDDSFGIRDEARSQLTALATDSADVAAVQRLLSAHLADKRLSLDVREVLRTLAPIRPAPPQDTAADSVAAPAAAELAALFKALEAATFAERNQAESRLVAAAAKPSAAGSILSQIASQVDRDEVTVDAARRWQTVWEAAWRTWLTSPADAWHPPAPSEDELSATLGALVAAEPNVMRPAWIRRHATASRRLLLWLADDGLTKRIAASINARLAAGELSADAASRLEYLSLWARPALAAEIWSDGQFGTLQHLVIGVPNQPPTARNPSLFDACDGKTAHCVSGNLLSPGDYPVGVFFQPPTRLEGTPPASLMFHLNYLPTARARLAYDFEAPSAGNAIDDLQQIDALRKADVTRRTVDYLLAQKRILTDHEIDMFPYLDAKEAARFAAPYLLGVDDERYDSGSPQAFGNGSLHGWFCYTMTLVGTPEAGRGIAAAIDKNRILEPTASKPFRIEWAAFLALAQSDPWPEADAWLAAQIGRTEPLCIADPDAADVGASAAALLLQRHDVEPSRFDLARQEFPELIDLGNVGHRFTKPESRERVRQWWRERVADKGVGSRE